ncbi:MAG: alpha/beta hydrolase family protein [Luteibaculum sp.]
MKAIRFLIALVISLPSIVFAQDIVGDWEGNLMVQGQKLPLVIHIKKNGQAYSTTLDSPMQGAKGIPVSSTSYVEGKLQLDMASMGAKYTGNYVQDRIEGIFEQAGMKFPLTFERQLEEVIIERPQTPKPPFPYSVKEVVFSSKEEGIKLAGTLNIPDDCDGCPAVILISGSGPQNRNSEIFNHQPFWVLADHLAKSKIAVLRFDDRGVGSSQGNFQKAVTQNFANDVRGAISFLKTQAKVDSNKVGLLGHSEGSTVAAMVAADTDVAFLVSLAGPGLPGHQILLKQQKDEVAGASLSDQQEKDLNRFLEGQMDLLKSQLSNEELKGSLKKYYKKNFKLLPAATREIGLEKFTLLQTQNLSSPWLKGFISIDPYFYFNRVNCPVLALNGEKDTQVEAESNLTRIAEALKEAGNEQVETMALPELNHLFQPSNTGALMEYGSIETTFDQDALNRISSWIVKIMYE